MNKYLNKMMSSIAMIALSTPIMADSSVNSSLLDTQYPDVAIVSTCKTHGAHLVDQGKRLQPSNSCRVINYYLKKKHVGAIKIPEGEYFTVPWKP